MNKKEFQEKINKANRELRRRKNIPFSYLYPNGVCCSLDKAFDSRGKQAYLKVVSDFQKLFKPKYTTKDFWLGERTEENLCRRELALRLFEQYVIENKLYKDYV